MRSSTNYEHIGHKFFSYVNVFDAHETSKYQLLQSLINEGVAQSLAIKPRSIESNLINMSPSWIFLEIVLWIFVKVIKLWIRIERISYQRHLEGIPDLAKERIGSNAYWIAVCNLKCNLAVISNWINFVNSVYCLLRIANSRSYFLYLINMEQIALAVVF